MEAGIVSGASLVGRADREDAVRRAATGFHACGVGAGDAVAWMLRNDIPVFETTAAAGLLGAYPVPVNWPFSAEEVAYVLRDSAAKVLVVRSEEHTSELQSLMRISYAVSCLKIKNTRQQQ